jgi:hypothetical protein
MEGQRPASKLCCTTLMIHRVAMATTQVARTTCHEFSWERQEEQTAEFRPVRMNWVVVTDENGLRHLRIRWGRSEDNELLITHI